MNAINRVQSKVSTIQVSHQITAYSKASEEIVSECPVPGFLDSLALKIAETDEDDINGVFSYKLNTRQLDTFRFILRMTNLSDLNDYFLEPLSSDDAGKLPEIAAEPVFHEMIARSMSTNRKKRRITESELTVPTLRILAAKHDSWVKTSSLIKELTEMFQPTGTDADLLAGRSDTYFSQKVRNIISHKDRTSSFIKAGLAEYDRTQHGLRITKFGKKAISTVRTIYRKPPPTN